MERINWRSDFDLAVGADALARMPEGSALTLTLRTAGSASFTATASGNNFVNCRRDEDGRLRVLAKDHGLPCGRLRLELRADIPDTDFTGGLRTVCDVWDTGVTLVPGKAGATEAEVEALLPLVRGERGEKGEKGDRGEPLTWEDLTEEQVAELRRPAEEAAAEAREVAGTYSAVLAGKAERSELSNVLAEEPLTPGNFPEIGQLTRERLKMDLFIDMWNVACTVNGRVYGKYDPENAPDAEHPFMLNGLWFTYAEAVRIYTVSRKGVQAVAKCLYRGLDITEKGIRTLLPVNIAMHESDFAQAFNGCGSLEYLSLVAYTSINMSTGQQAFNGCRKLRVIDGAIYASYSSAYLTDMFKDCEALEEVRFYSQQVSFSWADSPRLSLESVAYAIEKKTSATAITITVHADVYAKLADAENAEWHALVAAAAAKNITFAKP